VAGDADEAGDFLFFQLLDRGEHTAIAADLFEIVKIAQAVNLNEIDIIGLQEPETQLDRAQRAVAVARIDFRREENLFAPFSGKIAESLFAQSFDGPARVRTGGVEIIDA
jgi:hypothetical protein